MLRTPEATCKTVCKAVKSDSVMKRCSAPMHSHDQAALSENDDADKTYRLLFREGLGSRTCVTLPLRLSEGLQ